MAEALRSALDTLITFLRTNGYTNCCEHCGRPEGVDAYTVSGNAYLLCEPCFGQVSEAAAQQNQTKMQKQEQVLPGIVGALIGSLYVAAVSGLVMAICTLKGYEMLGKKLGTPGIIISCVLMLLMIFLAYQADWSITAAQFYETDFFTAFRAMMDLIKEGYVDSGDYSPSSVPCLPSSPWQRAQSTWSPPPKCAAPTHPFRHPQRLPRRCPCSPLLRPLLRRTSKKTSKSKIQKPSPAGNRFSCLQAIFYVFLF